MEERFSFADKLLIGNLMAELLTMKNNKSRSMQEYIIEMTNIAARLKTLGLVVDDSFLVYLFSTHYVLKMASSD